MIFPAILRTFHAVLDGDDFFSFLQDQLHYRFFPLVSIAKLKFLPLYQVTAWPEIIVDYLNQYCSATLTN